MEASGMCKSCKRRDLVVDFVTGNMVCSSCGVIQGLDNFEHDFGGFNGPTGTFIRTGTAGAGSKVNFKENKIYQAIQEIGHITSLLDMSDSRKSKVKEMVDTLTDGEFGQGYWLPLCIGACSYVVMRQDEKFLPLAEVASKTGCNVNELGRMVKRIVDYLELKLPEFDLVGTFERGFRTCFDEDGIGKDMAKKMMKQGIFLVQCLVKWWLTTGRRPLPIVVAVLVFIAQLNNFDIRIDDVAMKLHAVVFTSRVRYKELLERLVEVAQMLPWGKDITVKNIVKNAPFVIQYMELKSMSKHNQQEKGLSPNLHDLDGLVDECLSAEVEYGMNNAETAKDSCYFELESKTSSSKCKLDDLDELRISHECLSVLYSEFSKEVSETESVRESRNRNRRKRQRGVDLSQCLDWWKGKSELSKKLVFKKILEQDVGLKTMPPSFVSGCLANSRRREKIQAAKLRIAKIMNPQNSSLSQNNKPILVKCTSVGKKRRTNFDADWEDLIIETLLLHQVKEEEIEKGHYNTLLDLHVFN